jgi:hypothetical protein
MHGALALSVATAALAFGLLLPQLSSAQSNSTADQFLPHLKPGITRGAPHSQQGPGAAPATQPTDPPPPGAAHHHTAPEAHSAGEQDHRSEGLSGCLLSTVCVIAVTLRSNDRSVVSN